MNKRICLVLIALCLSTGFLFPIRVRAQVLPPFGGYSVFVFPCTCSFATWAWFAPLYLTSVPITGPLVYAPYATLPYPNFLTSLPSVPHLGGYVPGVQACWQYAGVTCFPLPSIGVMGFAGTGL
jgi:hypothetical protein